MSYKTLPMRTLTTLITGLLFFTTTLSAADYYWIGGTGNWSDISHWATTTNGIITHSQAPTADDDVFFDFNSFSAPGQIVTLNNDLVFCRSMSWNGVANNPTFLGGANVTINVFGSWMLDPNMNFDFAGRILFTGNQVDNMVSFGTHNAGQDVNFSGTGAWTLTSGITVDSAFIFTEGTLNTNNQNVDCLYFDARYPNNRTLNLAFSIITIRGGTIDPFNGNYPPGVTQPMYIDAANLTMDGGGSTFIFINPIVDIWLSGTGDINFNRLILSSPMGNSKIIPYDPLGTAIQPNMNYNELNLFHSTLLNGSPQIVDLILHPDQRYLFEAGETFTFGTIEAFGTCSTTIVMESTGGGQAANFVADNNITVSFVSLKGIAASGAGNFTANNALDLGNNTGWTINPRVADDFFWIGGTGNWNDPAHWSFSSGGAPSGCIPSAVDDVFFDQNSFSAASQSVTINIENAYCHNMDWSMATNMPNLAGPIENNLHITASLTLIANMQHSFEGNYHFESEEMGNTITTAGQPFNYDLLFSGLNGEWTFQDDIYVFHSIFFKSGTLRTNDQNIDAFSFLSEEPFQRSLYLGNSYITIDNHGIAASVWHLNSTSLLLDAGTSTIETTGAFSNLIRTSGAGTAVYNNIIFSCYDGRFFSNIDPPGSTVEVDSLVFNQSGFTSGSNIVNYLYMSPGHTYVFVPDATQTITELDASGDCTQGFTRIKASSAGNTFSFDIANDHVFDRLSVKGCQQIGIGMLQANNSLDDGGNSGWNFTNATNRNLFWVGGDGDWNDPAHWSLTSGGAGGECIPTPLDDVTFDDNSFPVLFASVSNILNNNSYCRNMTWAANVANDPTFVVDYINIYGSLDVQGTMLWNNFSLFFNGIDNHTIATTVPLHSIFFEGIGTYVLMSDVQADDIRQETGTFDTNNFNLTASRLICDRQEAPKSMFFRNSYILLTGGSPNEFAATFHVFSDGLTLDAGQSTIELSNEDAGMRFTYPLTFHNVIFSNPESNAYLIAEDGVFNHVHFHGNGDLRGRMETDTLICSPGKSYVFDANQIQRINDYWQIIGNNCTPISLSSSIIGSQASVYMPPGSTRLADFIQMQYMTGIGGANFFAGAHSTDINNTNIEWIFENAPDFIELGFLGEDVALCSGDPVTLDAYQFTVSETYLWQDGSMDTTLIVDQSGTYSVQVTFGDNCVIRDTINVLAAQDFNVDIQDDPSFCDGETLTLDANVGINGASYLWQDGSTDNTLTISSAGMYAVTVDIGGCTATDVTNATTQFYPSLDLGDDLSLCEGDDFTLASNVVSQSFLWQDGSTVDSFTGNAPGIYWLEAANGQCAARDSVEVTYVSSSTISLGADTLLCDQIDFSLGLNVPNSTYEWQDGSTLNTFLATQNGEYWVEVTAQGCSARDSIVLTFQNNPSIEFGDEIFGCEGDEITLSSPVVADSYEWSDGDMDADFSSNMAGTYFLDATFGACVVRENFEIILNTYPVIQSLGDDVNLCEGETLDLNAVTDIGTITWQDGSVTSNFTVNTAGIYWYTADNNGCAASDTIDVAYTNYPDINLGDDLTLCEGDTQLLETNAPADSYEWQDGSNATSFLIATAGTIWLEAANGDCIIRDSLEVFYVEASSVQLGADTTLCDQTDYLLAVNIPMATYEWSDGSTLNTLNTTSSGLYWVEATIQGCSARDSIMLTFQDNPRVEFGDEIFACQGDVINLSSPVIADSYEWSDGDMDADFSSNMAGIYFLDATFGTCVVRGDFEIILNDLPIIQSLGADATICDGESLTLNAITDIGNIIWQDGSGNTTFNVVETGVYWFVADNNGCTASDTISITTLESPQPNLGPDQTACEGDSIVLSIIAPVFGMPLWSDGSTMASLTVNQPSLYWLEVENGQGCIGRDSININFATAPSLEIGKDTTVCDSQPFIVVANFSEGQLSWPNGSTQDTYAVEKQETVIATLDNDGCITKDTIQVNFKECHVFQAYIPNVFSPNEDGNNDRFLPQIDPDIQILSYTLNIFNRWGSPVYSTTDINAGWDGKFNNELLDFGVYVYFIEINFVDDLGEGHEILAGDVVLLR